MYLKDEIYNILTSQISFIKKHYLYQVKISAQLTPFQSIQGYLRHLKHF